MNYNELKKVLDGLTTELIQQLDTDELMLLLEYKEKLKYNKVFTFLPYPFQMKMYEAGKTYRSRFACLANRIGKTYSAAAEVAYHLTGTYPTVATHGWDWPGVKYDRPILLWAVGITSESTRTVLQKEIFGTEMAKVLDEIGTGSIPREYIDFETMERDGNRIIAAKIKHFTDGKYDGQSTLIFKSTQQGLAPLMGAKVDFILLDEEDQYKSNEIYSQCLMRTGTVPDGRVLITATPEVGFTELIRKFTEEEGLFIFHAGWNDAPHLTAELKKELLDGIPEWEIPMRTQGIPSKGSGAIFPIDDENITIEPLVPEPHWPVVAAVDFGQTRDPSVVMFITRNLETGQYIIYDEIYLDVDRSVENIAEQILNTHTPNIPVIVPNDGNRTDGGSETRATILRNLGCNVVMGVFNNPEFIRNRISNVKEKDAGKEGGIHWMAHGFKSGSVKVVSTCYNFFRQKRSYFWVSSGAKTKPRDGNDDTIDCARYGLLSIDRHGVPFGQSHNSALDFNNGFSHEPVGINFYNTEERQWNQ